MLRTYARWFVQLGLPLSQAYMEEALASNAAAAGRLLKLFLARFDPALSARDRRRAESAQRRALGRLLAGVTRIDDDLAPDWPTGNGSYRVMIKGTPAMKLEYEFCDERGDHAVGGVVLTATRIVNAIPAVCAATPGLLTVLDLPLITGRGLMAR